MHKKRKLRYKTTSLGKHFVLVSQNLEYKNARALFILLGEKRGYRRECTVSKIFHVFFE